MSQLSGKEKIERDYREFVNNIEQKAVDELKRIREKAAQIRSEAQGIGESLERSIRENEEQGDKKKS